MPQGGGAAGGRTHGCIIRERSISSRPIGDEECKVMDQWQRDGMPSLGRPEHDKKLAEAQAIDKGAREAAVGEPQPD